MDSHVFVKSSKRGTKTFLTPNFSAMSRVNLRIGEKVILPMERSRRGLNCLWESGCRKLTALKINHDRPYGIVIADKNDGILNAIGYNRAKRGLKFIQALVPLSAGAKVYFGSLNIKKNSLSLSIRVYQLTYKGEHRHESYPDSNLGEFVVTEIYKNYQAVESSIPAQRLVKKLYTTDVNRPFFANAWGYYKSKKPFVMDLITSIANKLPINPPHPDFCSLIDSLENASATAAGFSNTRPLVMQVFDFDQKLMTMSVISGVDDSTNTVDIDSVQCGWTGSIRFDDIDYRYNNHLTIGSDISNLRFVFEQDSKNYNVVQLPNNVWVLIRTFNA